MAFKVMLIFVLEQAKIGAEPVRKQVGSRGPVLREIELPRWIGVCNAVSLIFSRRLGGRIQLLLGIRTAGGDVWGKGRLDNTTKVKLAAKSQS